MAICSWKKLTLGDSKRGSIGARIEWARGLLWPFVTGLYENISPFVLWRQFITTTRIVQGFACLYKLRLLLFKPRWDYQFRCEKENEKDHGQSTKMTPNYVELSGKCFQQRSPWANDAHVSLNVTLVVDCGQTREIRAGALATTMATAMRTRWFQTPPQIDYEVSWILVNLQ